MFIDVEQPFVAASLDGIVSCTCCGKGTVEVKCPFCVKEGLPAEDEKENSCSRLTWQDGKWTLAKDHALLLPWYRHRWVFANWHTATS